MNHLWAKVEDLNLDAGDVVAQTASIGFDISVWQFLSAVLPRGRRVVVIDKEIQLDPPRLFGCRIAGADFHLGGGA